MTTANHIVYNMFKNGFINGGNEVAQFITADNQYKFELNRNNYELWCTDTSYKYKCTINIYNKITNNLLVSLILTEEDVRNLLDCYTQMDGFAMQDIIVPPLKPYSANGNFYYIILEQYRIDKLNNVYCDNGNRWFTIREYNPLMGQKVDILSVQMDVSEMEELMDLIYFIFLIDLESENQLVPIADMFPSEYSRYVKDNSYGQ